MTTNPAIITCANCDSPRTIETLERQTFTYGAGLDKADLTVQVPVITCQDCGDALTDWRAEEIRHTTVCRHLGRLTPAEIATNRLELGLSQNELGILIDVSEAKIQKFETGELIVPPDDDQKLRGLFQS